MIPINGQKVYEAVMKCDFLDVLHRNGASHYILPAGTVQFKQRNGAVKTLDCNLTVSVRCYTERMRKLNQLIAPERSHFFWTMRDFCYALKVPYTSRWRGEIGKDLKALRIYCGSKRSSRRKLYGLIDARTKKAIPLCLVFCRFPFNTQARDIRRFYREQAAERLRACQQMRSSG